jgi:hypothetical protein
VSVPPALVVAHRRGPEHAQQRWPQAGGVVHGAGSCLSAAAASPAPSNKTHGGDCAPLSLLSSRVQGCVCACASHRHRRRHPQSDKIRHGHRRATTRARLKQSWRAMLVLLFKVVSGRCVARLATASATDTIRAYFCHPPMKQHTFSPAAELVVINWRWDTAREEKRATALCLPGRCSTARQQSALSNTSLPCDATPTHQCCAHDADSVSVRACVRCS